MSLITVMVLQESDYPHIRQMFEALDRDHDGFVTGDDLEYNDEDMPDLYGYSWKDVAL